MIVLRAAATSRPRTDRSPTMRALMSAFFHRLPLLILAAVVVTGCAQVSPAPKTGIERMYVIDCGEAQIPDISPWAPGTAPGTEMLFSDNCYLIKHTKGYLLWDSGFTDTLADKPDGMQGNRGMVMKRRQ